MFSCRSNVMDVLSPPRRDQRAPVRLCHGWWQRNNNSNSDVSGLDVFPVKISSPRAISVLSEGCCTRDAETRKVTSVLRKLALKFACKFVSDRFPRYFFFNILFFSVLDVYVDVYLTSYCISSIVSERRIIYRQQKSYPLKWNRLIGVDSNRRRTSDACRTTPVENRC
jgi:hypothetical protein